MFVPNDYVSLISEDTEPYTGCILLFVPNNYVSPWTEDIVPQIITGCNSPVVLTAGRYTPGSTNTAGGLRQAHQMFQPGFGERRTAQNVVILLTDGQSNINYYDTIPAATDLKSDGVTVIGIGIGLTNADELNAIASGPREVFQVATFDALNDIKAEIVSVSGLDTVCTGGCLYAPRIVSQKKILQCILSLVVVVVVVVVTFIVQ